ncbi:MAG: LPXTG cell wall anchor domain-containing protein [Candidatus Diapherotrites archaeon]|nr:LPXTG cell wall anchor domain-containing protein [Candidatus Diapherotrites archaeon]
MRWALLLLLIPVVLAVPQEATLITLDCGGEVEVYYAASGDSITLFYTENPSYEVARTFYTYYKLLSVIDSLGFLNDSTITSLRSLKEALKEYELQLLQARSLSERYDVPLDLRELNEEVIDLQRLIEAYVTRLESLKSSVHRFLEYPSCDYRPDLNVIQDFEIVYGAASRIIELSQQIKTRLAAEENVDLTLVNALSELITPPFSRTDLDELLSRAQSDYRLLSLIFNPSEEDVARLIELSKSYAAYEELSKLLNERIVTEVGVFPDMESAVNFVLAHRDELKEGDRATTILNLYDELKTLMEEKRYSEALPVAKKLRSELFSVLNAGFREEEAPEGPSPLLLGGLLLVLAIIIFLRRRKRVEEDADDLSLDDYGLE